jgi:hypothetical protein
MHPLIITSLREKSRNLTKITSATTLDGHVFQSFTGISQDIKNAVTFIQQGIPVFYSWLRIKQSEVLVFSK